MRKKRSESISYIIVAYNEGNIIADTIDYCISCLKNDFDDFELILVDDGSTDNTLDIMNEKSKEHENIKVLRNLINLNLGIALQRGIVTASKEYITYNAADLPLDPKRTGKLISIMKDADVLVLQRRKYIGANMWRKVTSLINRFLLYLLFPNAKKGIRDTNYVQIIRKDVVKHILPISRGPIFTCPEIIFRAKYAGLRVKVINIEYNPRCLRKGAFGKPHDIIWGMYEMFRFRLIKSIGGI